MASADGGVLSRTSLLALYASPLVPNKLEGMKELSEWYGEYTTPPSPPIQRSQLSSSRQNSSSAVPQTNSGGGGGGRRLTPFNSDSNPFANFGRFGVDGGLLGEPIEMPRRRGNKLQSQQDGAAGETTPGGGKDLAPHLLQQQRGIKRGDDIVPPWASSNNGGEGTPSKRDQFLREERSNRRNGDSPSLEPRRLNNRNGDNLGGMNGNGKDSGRRGGLGQADEGGWRSVGTTREEREKRLLRNQNNNNSNSNDSPRRFDNRDRRDNNNNNDREREREPYSRRGGPAWMNDEDSSSSPSWMDTSASGGNLKFSKDGVALESSGDRENNNDDEILDVSTPTKKNTEWQASSTSGNGGMDSIQQWKAQMKEMERKERERDLRDAGIEPQSSSKPQEPESVFSALTSPKPESASATRSIFEDLGIVRSPAVTPAQPPGLNVQSQGESTATAGGGGRGSRFAKFFDGKPQSPVTQAAQQPPPSVFGALMGGGNNSTTAGPGPSKEDADSMARLLGMLQVQGSRTGSPAIASSRQPEPTPSGLASPAVAPSPAPSSTIAEPPTPAALPAEESRSSSRFKFSNSSAARTSSPSVGSRSVPPSQPPSAVHSPTASNQSIPAPPPPGFSAGLQQSHPSSLNHLPPPTPQLAVDRMRSPPLPVPQSQQGNLHHPRTISSTSDLGSRPGPPPSSVSPLPLPGQSMNHPHHHHQGHSGPVPPPPPPPGSFPPQFYNNTNSQNNSQRIPPPPPMGMYPPGPGGNQSIPPSHQMMNHPEMLRNLAAAPNGMRSPPLPLPGQQTYSGGGPGVPPPSLPHGMMPPPHSMHAGAVRGGGPPQMMGYPPQFQQQQPGAGGGIPRGPGGMPLSMGGNAGADLMALLNSGGNGGMRIGGQGPIPPPPPGHPHHQQQHSQQGNLPPYLMEGR
ncbi:hypothetical protein JCM3765_003338 [Sporobolomyces pararoseus]